MKNIKSTYSFLRVFLIGVGLAVGFGLAKLGVTSLLFRAGIAGDVFDRLSRSEEFYTLGVAVFAFWSTSIIVSAQYIVEQEGILVRHWWRKHYILWKDVERIVFQTNFGFGYVVHIKRNDKMLPVRLVLAGVGNGHKLGKGMIEAATAANPSIHFLGAHEYGPPPYGIFTGDDKLQA